MPNHYTFTKVGQIMASTGAEYFPCFVDYRGFASFPHDWAIYHSTDHDAGAGGIYLYVADGDPTSLSNWSLYDTDPIYVDDVAGSGTESPHAVIIGSTVHLTYHNDGPSTTALATSSDGLTFTRVGHVLPQSSGFAGGNHTGYFRWGPNVYSDVPYAYSGISSWGNGSNQFPALWGTDDGLSFTRVGLTERWKARLGLGTGWLVRHLNHDPFSVREVDDGFVVLTTAGEPAGGGANPPTAIYEALFGPDGRTLLKKPRLVLPRGSSGYDAQMVSMPSTVEYNGQLVMVFNAVGSGVNSLGIAVGSFSSSADPFDDLDPPYRPSTKRYVDFRKVTSLPSWLQFEGSGSLSFDSTNGLTITPSSGQTAGVKVASSVVPQSVGMVEINTLVNRATNGNARVPILQISADGPGLTGDGVALYTNTTQSGIAVLAAREGGSNHAIETATDYAFGQGDGGSGSINAQRRRDIGLRWYANDDLITLAGHAGGEPSLLDVSGATIDQARTARISTFGAPMAIAQLEYAYGTAGDAIAPTVTARVQADDNEVGISFSEDVIGVDAADFSFEDDGDPVAITSLTGTGRNYIAVLESTVTGPVTWSYDGTAVRDVTEGNLLATFTDEEVDVMAFPEGWTRKAPITVDRTKVGSGGVTNFSLKLTEANLPPEVFTESDGGDIRFSSDEEGTTQLAVDIVAFDAGSETAKIVVKVASLSDSADTTVWLWWGNELASAPAVDSTYGRYAAYHTDYAMAVPFEADFGDRTGKQTATPINSPTIVSGGQIGSAGDFNGSTQSVTYVSGDPLTGGAVSVSGWIKLDALPTQSWIAGKATGTSNGWGLRALGDDLSAYYRVPTLRNAVAADVLSTGTFFHVGMQILLGDGVRAFLNGVQVAFVSAADGSYSTSGEDFRIGRQSSASTAILDGLMDELHVVSSARGAAWFATVYANESSPATFATAGEAQSTGMTAGTLSLDSKTHNSATLSWTEASGNTGTVTEQLQRSTDYSGDPDAATWSNVSGATSSPATNTGLTPETEYHYSVAQTDDEGSVRTNVVSVTTDEAPPVPVPSLSVSIQGGAAITSGGTDALGTLAQGSTQTRTYTLTNDGDANLILGTVSVGPGLTITTNPSGQTIAPEGTATLAIAVTTSAVAEIDAAVSIPSNDEDSPYTWDVTASVTDQTAPTVTSRRIKDNILTLRFSEPVWGNLSQLALTASGGALTITGDDTLTAATSISVELSRAPDKDETITATLSEPSGILDAAENEMAGFVDEPVSIAGESGVRHSRLSIGLGIGF